MRLLLAILVLAIAGLLWATIAAAQHIRRARRRRKGLTGERMDQVSPPASTAGGDPRTAASKPWMRSI